MDLLLESLIKIASLPLIKNIDINNHIISCRKALQLIELKDKQLKLAYEKLNTNKQNRIELQKRVIELEEELKTLKEESNMQKEIIIESYKLIDELNHYGRR